MCGNYSDTAREPYLARSGNGVDDLLNARAVDVIKAQRLQRFGEVVIGVAMSTSNTDIGSSDRRLGWLRAAAGQR